MFEISTLFKAALKLLKLVIIVAIKTEIISVR